MKRIKMIKTNKMKMETQAHNAKEYFAVCVKCGHVGMKYYIPVALAVRADSAKNAASFARECPRVKHHHKDTILWVKKISEFEYLQIRKTNDNDPYLHARSRSEHKALLPLFKHRILKDPHWEKWHGQKRFSSERKTRSAKYDHKTQIRCPKSYARFHAYDESNRWSA